MNNLTDQCKLHDQHIVSTFLNFIKAPRARHLSVRLFLWSSTPQSEHWLFRHRTQWFFLSPTYPEMSTRWVKVEKQSQNASFRRRANTWVSDVLHGSKEPGIKIHFLKQPPKNFKWVNLKLAARFIKIYYYENNLNTGGWFISETFYRLIYHSSLSILPLKTPLYLSLTDFSQEKRLNITFCERRTRKKTLGVSLRMNHTFNPHATPNLGVEPRPQWREVSAFTKCKARFRIGSGEKSSP